MVVGELMVVAMAKQMAYTLNWTDLSQLIPPYIHFIAAAHILYICCILYPQENQSFHTQMAFLLALHLLLHSVVKRLPSNRHTNV